MEDAGAKAKRGAPLSGTQGDDFPLKSAPLYASAETWKLLNLKPPPTCAMIKLAHIAFVFDLDQTRPI